MISPIREKRLGQPGLALGGKQLAPSGRAGVALNELARVRRLEVDAAVAVLIALRCSLIFGVGLGRSSAALPLAGPPQRSGGTKCKRGAGERRTA